MYQARSVILLSVVVYCGVASLAGAQPPGPDAVPLDLLGGSSAVCPAPTQLSLSRPDSDGPTTVSTGLFLADVVAIDDVTQSMTTDLFVVLRWTDSRLADPDRGSTQAVCALSRDAVWMPLVQARGLRRLESLYPDITAIDAAGTVTFARRAIAETGVPLDLRGFPFDRHSLTLELETVFSSVEEVRLVPLTELSGIADRLSITGWSIGSPTVTVDVEPAPRLQIDHSVFRFAVEARREWQFYVWKAIAPLTLIVFMSWAVFWIDPQQIARIGLSATAILTLIAYQFAFSSLLPRVSYLTRADRFTMSASVLVFLALVEAVTASALTRQGRLEASDRLDRYSRVGFPVALAAIISVAFLV
jgi:hypothetical protein